MFWQKEMLREAVSMTLNDTYELDLPDWGSLGSLLIRISGSQASGLGQNGGSWRILDYISKLEILLNGATVGKSLKGDMLQAIAFYDQRITSPDSWRNYATNTQYCYFLLNFGRYLKDKELGLQLDKFKSVELKLSNTATSSEFSDLTVSIMAIWRREIDTPFSHFMRTEEWRKWTTAQDETKYYDLPTQYIIRRLLLQAIPAVDANNVEKTGMHNLMDDVDLSFATGTIRVYKGGIDDIMRLNLFDYGRNIITGGFPYMNADYGINMGLGYVNMSAHGAGAQDGAAAATIPTMESGRTSFTQKAETYEADSPICLMAGGMAYHNTVIFPFGEDNDIESWLDPDARKTVKLDIHTRDTSSSASGTARIIIDRLVPTPE